MPFVPLAADAGDAPVASKQGFTPIDTPLEYETNPIAERAKYVAGVVPGVAETAVGGAIDFAGNIGAGVGGMIYGAAPAIWKGQKINWSDPNNPFYQEYAKEQGLWSRNISPVLAPQTEAGKDIMGGFTNIAEKMKSLGEKVTDITGSEAAGAWTEAALQTLGIPLGLKALGVVPMVGAGVAAKMARGKGTPEAVAPESASVADQLKAIRPEAPVKPPETPTAAPETPPAQGFTPVPTAAPAPVWPEPGAKPTPEQSAQMAKDAEAYRKLQEETKTPDRPMPVPPDAAGFAPKPGDVPTAPRHGVPGVPVVEVPIAGLKLADEVPQFKKGADKEGIVVPLGGKFDRIGVAPIQVWQRLNGDMEIISGRHRWDLAKRSGEETLPAQIHREADGFDAKQAAILDAELNIRDEQGGVNDYANYFRNSGIDQETANAKGLLARAKGKAGWTIGRDASDEVFAAHGASIISDEAALAFSRAAPKDSAAQAVGLKMINEGRSVSQAENTIRAIAMMQKNGEAKPEQGDIFGFDDSAIREAEAMAKKASAAQRAIREQLAAVSGATKRPEIARKLGVIVDDPGSVKAAIDRLRIALDRLANWPLYPDLVREFRGEEPLELKGETEAEIQAKESAKAKAAEEEHARAAAPPPEDFVMTGSTRPADEAAARGQNDMFGNTPLKPEEGKGIFDAIVQGMRRKAGKRRAVEGRPLEGLKEDRRVAAAMRRREEASTKPATTIQAAKTGQPFQARLMRGQGRDTSPYNELVPQEGILGKGRYTTTDPEFAKYFGPKITEHDVRLENPLVIENDAQWRALTKKAGWEFPNPISMTGDTTKASAGIANLRAMIEADGHDGVIVKVPEYESEGKTMQKIFEADQVIEFKPEPTKGEPVEKTAQAKPSEKKQPEEPAKPIKESSLTLGSIYRDWAAKNDHRISAYPSEETLAKYDKFAKDVLAGNDPLTSAEDFSRFKRLREYAMKNGFDLATTYKAFDNGQDVTPEGGLKSIAEKQAKPVEKPARKKVADVPSLAEKGETTEWLKGYKTEEPKLSIGRTPNSAEPISVRDGKIFIGEYPATNFETGEDVTIADDATPQQIKDALMEAGAIGAGQKIFGMKEHVEKEPSLPEAKPVSDTVKRIMAERERAKGKGEVKQERATYGEPAPTFFSQLSRSVASAPDKIFGNAKSVSDWLNANASKLGVKKAEIEATGLDDWLKLQGKVTKADVQNFLDHNGVQVKDVTLAGQTWAVWDEAGKEESYFDTKKEAHTYAKEMGLPSESVFMKLDSDSETKFSSYQLPGGKNYKELLLTLPRKNGTAADAELDKYSHKTGDFKSPHFDQPNILAHIRFNERTDADGKRVLFLEELQSDFGQSFKKAKDAIGKAVDSDFQGIIERMKKASVLEVNCD